jgi:hypothetical protein
MQDSINMWGMISGVEATSPRQEIPHCINHPLYNWSALTVGDYKLLLGPQTLAFWQGPD